MDLYSHSKLTTVERERLELLKKPLHVGFIPFDINSNEPLYYSPRLFKREASAYWARQSLKTDYSLWDRKLEEHKRLCNFGILSKPDGFALFPVQPSGVVEQGALS